MKRFLIIIIAVMALGLTALATPNTAEAGRWRGGYRGYSPGYYGGYYRGYRPYRSYYNYNRGYRPYRYNRYYNNYYGWGGPRGYVATPWIGVGW